MIFFINDRRHVLKKNRSRTIYFKNCGLKAALCSNKNKHTLNIECIKPIYT